MWSELSATFSLTVLEQFGVAAGAADCRTAPSLWKLRPGEFRVRLLVLVGRPARPSVFRLSDWLEASGTLVGSLRRVEEMAWQAVLRERVHSL